MSTTMHRPAAAGQPTARWRKFVNERPIAALLLTGVIATQLGTYFGYVFPAVGLPPLPWPLYNGILGTTIADGFNKSVVDEAFAVSGEAFFVGNTLHYINGIVFAVLWGVFFRDSVPIKNTYGGNIMKGLLYGLIMTIISAGLLVPYAYVPEQGYGFFLFDGPDGWKLPLGILIWHLIYGYFLGALWNPHDIGEEHVTVRVDTVTIEA
jgi:hypothetical protein